MRAGLFILNGTLLVCFGWCAIGFSQTDGKQLDADAITNGPPVLLAQTAPAQGNDQKPGAVRQSPTNSKTTDKKPANISKERRAELMAFVKEHHPAIRPLLNSLQKTNPGQYQHALRTLDRDVKALQALQKRAPARYRMSLGYWVTKSKIKLLSAKLAIKKTFPEQQAIEKQIFTLIQKQQDLRIAIVTADIKTTEKRLEKYKSDLSKLNKNRTAEIQRQMDVIKNNSQRIRLSQQKAADAKKKSAPGKKKPPSTDKPPTNKKDKSRTKDDKTNPKG